MPRISLTASLSLVELRVPPPRALLLGFLGLAVPAWGAGPARAAAAPPVAEAALDLDGDGQRERVAVSAAGVVTVQRPGAAEEPAAPLGGAVGRAQIEAPLAGGVRYLLVRAEAPGGDGQRRLLLATLPAGAPLRVLHAGPVGPIGRDGERSIEVRVAADGAGRGANDGAGRGAADGAGRATADGAAAADGRVERYQTAPGVVRCDGEARLYREQLSGGAFVPAPPPLDLRRAERVRAAPLPSGKAAPLPLYRAVAASDQAGAGRRADRLTPPQELTDGRADTAWRVAPADGAWITARAEGPGHKARGLLLVPLARGPRPPREVAVIFGPPAPETTPAGAGASAAPVRVELVPDSRAPQWVALPHPVPTACVSLVALDAGAEVALAEAGVYSELDEGGPAALVARALAVDAFGATEAARALAARAAVAPAEVLAVLPGGVAGKPAAGTFGTSAGGKPAAGTFGTSAPPDPRRLAALLAEVLPITARSQPGPTAAVLAAALRGAETGGDERLWAVVAQLGAAGEPLARTLLDDGAAAVRVRAARLLGERADAPTLTRAQALPRDARAALLYGLARGLRCAPANSPALEAALQALRAGASGTDDDDDLQPALVQALAQATARCPGSTPGLLADALVQTFRAATGDAFVLRYRVLQALEQLGAASPAVAGLLLDVLLKHDEPELRAAAARAAVATLGSDLILPSGGKATPVQVGLALRGLADPDPGVRLANLLALQGRADGPTVTAAEPLLLRDPWPMVRRAAAETRAAACAPLPLNQSRPGVTALRQALQDRDPGVRRLALSGVARCEGAGAAKLLSDTARDEHQGPGLRAQACALLVRVQGAAAEPVLRDVLDDVLSDPTADERSAGLALSATRGLGQVGGAESVPVLLRALGEPQSPALRRGAAEALGGMCARERGRAVDGRIPAALSQHPKDDPDPGARAAVERARALCRGQR